MKIKHKLLSGFISISLLILALGFITLTVQNHISDSFQKTAGQLLPGTIALTKVEAELYHSIALALKYVSTGAAKDKKEYQKTLATLKKYKAMHDLYHYHEDHEHLKRVEELVQEVTSLLMRYILLKEEGESQEKLHLARVEIDSLMGHFNSEIKSDVEQHIQEARDSIKTVKQRVDSSRNLIVVSSAAALFLAVILSIFIAQLISKPIIRLKEATQKIGQGNLDVNKTITSQFSCASLTV